MRRINLEKQMHRQNANLDKLHNQPNQNIEIIELALKCLDVLYNYFIRETLYLLEATSTLSH
jgi:hypothetical protein